MNNKVKEYRIKKEITQEQLSQISGVGRTVIAQLESGKRKNITSDTMLKISKALDEPVENIFLL